MVTRIVRQWRGYLCTLIRVQGEKVDQVCNLSIRHDGLDGVENGLTVLAGTVIKPTKKVVRLLTIDILTKGDG